MDRLDGDEFLIFCCTISVEGGRLSFLLAISLLGLASREDTLRVVDFLALEC